MSEPPQKCENNAIFDHNYTYSKTVIAFKGPILAVLFL